MILVVRSVEHRGSCLMFTTLARVKLKFFLCRCRLEVVWRARCPAVRKQWSVIEINLGSCDYVVISDALISYKGAALSLTFIRIGLREILLPGLHESRAVKDVLCWHRDFSC